jgi:hypothetical protein
MGAHRVRAPSPESTLTRVRPKHAPPLTKPNHRKRAGARRPTPNARLEYPWHGLDVPARPQPNRGDMRQVTAPGPTTDPRLWVWFESTGGGLAEPLLEHLGPQVRFVAFRPVLEAEGCVPPPCRTGRLRLRRRALPSTPRTRPIPKRTWAQRHEKPIPRWIRIQAAQNVVHSAKNTCSPRGARL